jgi:hypothetical protein
MDRKDVEALARFLAGDYIFDVRTKENACPVCFSNKGSATSVTKAAKCSVNDSPTSKHEARRKRFVMWMELFEEGGLDPIQCINVYIPSAGQLRGIPKFPYPLIISTKLGEPCAERRDCLPKCLLCNSLLNPEDTVTVPPWPSPVHRTCCVPCGHALPGAAKGVCCKTLVLSVPKFFEESLGIRIRCPEHRADRISPPGAAKAPPSAQKAQPTAKAQPAAPERPSAPASQWKPPKQRRLLPIERVRETRSHHIGKMLFPDAYALPPKQDKPTAKMLRQAAPGEPQPASRGPGASFFYGAKSFDFTEPKRLTVTSDDLVQQKDEDEARPGAGDGEPGAP